MREHCYTEEEYCYRKEQTLMTSAKRTYLRWFDILLLTIILFGEGIVNSTIQYLALQEQTTTLQQNLTFSPLDNYKGFAMQAAWLLVAVLYLLARNFDFSYFKANIILSPWVFLQAIGLFFISALCFDIFSLISYQFATPVTPSMMTVWPTIDFSLLLYSLLNGFYEEIFFLGICLAVHPRYHKWTFLYSLLIRCSFHTYQGLGNAIGLGLILGSIFYLFYQWMPRKNLLPFFLAHSLADIVGLTVIYYLYALL